MAVAWDTSNLKVLTDATGKVCTSCCTGNDCDACEPDPFPNGETPKYFDVIFSGVTLCPEKSWPGGVNLNTTWRLTQVNIPAWGGWCCWQYLDANWDILLLLNYFNGAGQTTHISASQAGRVAFFVRTLLFGGSLAACLAEASDIANGYTIEHCDTGYSAHSGTASWAKV